MRGSSHDGNALGLYVGNRI